MMKAEYYLICQHFVDELVQQEYGGDFLNFRLTERHFINELYGC